MKRVALLLLVPGMVVHFGCETMGSAAMVKRTRAGGTLALKGDRDKAWRDAEKKMRKHCHGPYTITEEEEVDVGDEYEASDETMKDGYGRTLGKERTRIRSRKIKEYRITYACGGTEEDAASPGAIKPRMDEPEKRTRSVRSKKATVTDDEGETEEDDADADEPAPPRKGKAVHPRSSGRAGTHAPRDTKPVQTRFSSGVNDALAISTLASVSAAGLGLAFTFLSTLWVTASLCISDSSVPLWWYLTPLGAQGASCCCLLGFGGLATTLLGAALYGRQPVPLETLDAPPPAQKASRPAEDEVEQAEEPAHPPLQEAY